MYKIDKYNEYRRSTGLCETCGHDMESHPICYLCGVLLGAGHISMTGILHDGTPHCGLCQPLRITGSRQHKKRGERITPASNLI